MTQHIMRGRGHSGLDQNPDVAPLKSLNGSAISECPK